MGLIVLYLVSVIINLSLLFFKIVPERFFNDSSDVNIIIGANFLPGITNIVTLLFITSILSNKIRKIYNIH